MNQPSSLDALRAAVRQLFDEVWSAKYPTFADASIFQKLQMLALIEASSDESYLRFLYDSLQQHKSDLQNTEAS